MEEIVKVVNLTKNFYTKEGEMEVLKNISFTLHEGDKSFRANFWRGFNKRHHRIYVSKRSPFGVA